MTSIGILLVLLFSFIKITNAFQHMDICNYTNWDTSGNYYDWLCTKDNKPAETQPSYIRTLNKNTSNINKIEKKHALNKVKHRTGASSPYAYSNNNVQKNKEIESLKNQISKQNILIAKYIKENNDLIKNQAILLKEITQKNNLLKKAKKQNNLLKYYIEKNSQLKKNIIKSYKKDVNIKTKANSTKTAAEIIKERIKKRNELLK